MNRAGALRLASPNRQATERIGTMGYVAAFAWLLVIAMATPAERLPWVSALCIGLSLWAYRQPARSEPVRRVGARSGRKGTSLRVGRVAIFCLLMLAPPLFVLGETDRTLFGFGYSSEGLAIAGAIALRMIIVFCAVRGFTSAVDCTALAGVLERVGLRGLGFALGVALNMAPCLQESALNMWQAMRMRGGLRRQWLRGVQLLTISVLCQALSRAEEIAIAADARGFSPERSRPTPIRPGRYERAIALGGALLLSLALIPWSAL